MTEDDFDLIEHVLAISLPDVYRRGLCPFPIAGRAGNTDTEVWDDARWLISLNQRLLAEVKNWPPWLFAIGQAEGDACGYAIDTLSAESPVWWLDHMRLGHGTGPTEEPFAAWFSRWVVDTSPKEASGRPLLWFLLVWLTSSVAGLIAFWLWVVRTNKAHRRRKR
jgi:hypothetical protein